MTAKSLKTILAVLFLATLGSCLSGKKEPDPNWQSSEVAAPSDRVLWKIALQSIQKMGFPLGADLDPGAMKVTSGWKNDLHPFSKRGQRIQAVLTMRPKERGLWTVEARVKRQLNEELARPLDPRYADWEWDADDVDSARILLLHIRSALAPELQLEDRAKDPFRRG